MLDEHSKVMDMQQLRELRMELRRMKDSPLRLRSSDASPDVTSHTEMRAIRPADYQTYRNGALTPAAAIQGKTYSVILYPVAPFVMIQDPPLAEATDPVADPGNVNQTRTPANGMLSGLTIELLEALKTEMGATFNYYYPCKKATFASTKRCDVANANGALTWLKDGDVKTAENEKYFGNMTDFCVDARCFVAGAIKIDASRLVDFRMTQPFLYSGFAMAVKSDKAAPGLMSAFLPFSGNVWWAILLEVILCGMAFIYCEGYGTNEALWEAPDVSDLTGIPRLSKAFMGYLAQLYDAAYWSVTILLGAHDKAPTTMAGRILMSFQLLYALILLTMYTGTVATFLMEEAFASKVKSFADFLDPARKPYYNSKNKICIPKGTQSAKEYLQTQEAIMKSNSNPNKKVPTVEGNDLHDCLKKVYAPKSFAKDGDVTAVIYDKSVLAVELTKLKAMGMCGAAGGYCSDTLIHEEEACEVAKKDWTKVSGDVEITGNLFNPFGYALAFKKVTGSETVTLPNSTNTTTRLKSQPWDYVAFGVAIQALRENNLVSSLESRFVPDSAEATCASGSSGPIQLGFANVSGLFMVTCILLFLGAGIGMMESIIALFVAYCPCCRPKQEEELEDEEVEEEPASVEEDEKRKKQKAEIHDRISQVQGRLLRVEESLGVKDADAAKDMLDVEDANGDAAAGEEDFMANLLASIGLKGAFSSTSV